MPHQRFELSDLVSNPNLKGTRVEVSAVPRGIQTKGVIRTGYTAFLEDNGALLLIQGDCDGGVHDLKEVSMLRTSSETGQPASLQGKIKGSYPEYCLKVSGVRLGDYTSILYEK